MSQILIDKMRDSGWYLSNEGLKQVSDNSSTSDVKTLVKKALDLDLREISSGILPEDINKGKSDSVSGKVVVQVLKVRNVSAPKANEESRAAPRMLKLTITDGITVCHALEYSNIQQLSLNTPPGTKLFLKGKTLPLVHGIILLTPSLVEVLGGKVPALIEKWEINRTLAKHQRGRVEGGPPPWVSFGQKIQRTNPQDRNFKSLNDAKDKEPNENRDEFEALRKDAIAEAAAKGGGKKVFGGGNKPLLDHNVQRLVDYGYSEQEAEQALRYTRHNVDRALKNLRRGEESSQQLERPNQEDQRPDRRERRKRGDRDDDTQKPSAPVSLFSFLEDKLPIQEEKEKTQFVEDRFTDTRRGGHSNRGNWPDNGSRSGATRGGRGANQDRGGWGGNNDRGSRGGNYDRGGWGGNQDRSGNQERGRRGGIQDRSGWGGNQDRGRRGGFQDRGERAVMQDRGGWGGKQDRGERGGYQDRGGWGGNQDRAERGGYQDRGGRGENQLRTPRHETQQYYRPKNAPNDELNTFATPDRSARNFHEQEFRNAQSNANTQIYDPRKSASKQPFNRRQENQSTAINRGFERQIDDLSKKLVSQHLTSGSFESSQKQHSQQNPSYYDNNPKPQSQATFHPTRSFDNNPKPQPSRSFDNDRKTQPTKSYDNDRKPQSQPAFQTNSGSRNSYRELNDSTVSHDTFTLGTIGNRNQNPGSKRSNTWVWHVGDKCMAKYWEDKKYHNAEVTGISQLTCVVRFSDYGNFEEVLMEDCLPVTAS